MAAKQPRSDASMGLSETAINGTDETVHSTSWSGSFNGNRWQIHCDDATLPPSVA